MRTSWWLRSSKEEDVRRRKESDLLQRWMDRKLRRRRRKRVVVEGCKGSGKVVEVDRESSVVEVGTRTKRRKVEVEVAEEDRSIAFDSRMRFGVVVDP